MKTRSRIFAVVLTAILLVCSIPTSVFASTYTVTLHCGPEGQGASHTLTKTAGEPLSLAYLRADVTARYGLEPKGGSADQRVFIKWSTSYDEKTARGTGADYFDVYDVDADVTLYAIWGYPIMFNADGGRFADGTTKKLEYVANYAEWMGESTDPKSMYRYNMPDWNGDVPVKEGARRVGNGAGPDGKGYAYGLIKSDGRSFFTWEGYGENLTIPPTGGAYYPSGNHNGADWSMFRCVSAANINNPYGVPIVEFMAIWEPSVTYDPNGGEGSAYSEYLTWDWKLWTYERYTIDNNGFSRENATFTGWNTKPDGSGKSYAAGKRVTNFGSNSNPVTLYAQWEISCQHSYESVTTDPTCAFDGTTIYTCSICGDSYSETIPATGEHSYEAVTTEPTCAADGSIVYTCSVCSDSYSEVIAATGEHSYESAITEPTCADDGSTVYTCSVCSDSYSEVIPATGEHSYGEWYVSLEPNYFEEGMKQRDCSVCDAYEENILPVKEYTNRFEDVSDSHWFADEVAYCVKKGYMNGMSDTVFAPNTVLTREQFVLLLANMAGVNTDEYKDMDSSMTDVKPGYWYSGAVYWAVNEGYVKGVSEGVFGRGQSITRSQLARLLYLYAEKQGMDMTVEGDPFEGFNDTLKIQSWAYDNLKWAVAKGIITGVKIDELSPNTTATRAQTARMIMIFDEVK
ncbi:MAG: S-layer homology domain-containing protein [Clostridia bacterium]|nr:S-layer homology domain-containing protein [Clostridia bacterium]